MAGRSRNTASRSAAANVAASSDPSRSRSASGPENAFCTGTCWSSAKPTSSAIGSSAISALASSESVKCRRSGMPRSLRCGGEVRPGALERLEQHLGRLGAGDAVAAVEHEDRDALDAELGGQQLVLAHGVAVAVAEHHRAGLVEVDAHLC